MPERSSPPPTEPPDSSRITMLLQAYAAGDAAAGDELTPIVEAHLHEIATRLMRNERQDHSLQATALVNEAWARLDPGGGDRSFEDRHHFLRLAARVMRNVLVDHARRRRHAARGGHTLLGLVEDDAPDPSSAIDIVDLHEALDRLAAKDDRLARIVELRFFAGLTLEETGEVLELTVRQVHRSWTLARAWLHRELGRTDAN